ncbi:AAA family ATPase [Sulfolobus sp. S-194]|uniref:AAA family ATPase n=1 Tax=Sulfolobus sp. S-194 TaxID=2512240 RepID=UPI00256FDAE9|nr:AAA family ATPase [Sulfolobus sp. S-194]
MKIIAITGMPGSGKGELAKILREKGIKVITMSDVLREKYYKEAKEGERLMDFAKRIRELYGKGAIAKLCIEKIEREKIVAFDGVRNWEEIEEFKKIGDVTIIAVHSPPKLRYERLLKRGRKDDTLTVEGLVKRDWEELEMGIGNVIALADYILINDSTIEEFKSKAEELLKRIL